MLKIFILFLFVLSHLNAVEINPKVLEEIIQTDPLAKKERVILAKYYLNKGNKLKALILLDEVLQHDPKNKNALTLQKIIERQEKNQAVFREASLALPLNSNDAQKRLDSYYTTNNYQFYSNLYQALNDEQINLADPYHIKAAYIYLWDARYKESQEAIARIKQTNNIDAAKINADICYYKGNYRCAAKIYEKLYNSSHNLEYAIKLIHSYIYLGETQRASRLYNYIFRKNPNHKGLAKLGKELHDLEEQSLLKKKAAYEKTPTYKTLHEYAIALYAKGRKQETLELLHNFNKENATKESLLLEAKYLMWEGRTQKALELLQNKNVNNALEAKLMLGQLYSWDQEFDKAKSNLDEVIQNASTKELLYNAKKARAFVFMWEKDTKKAKEIFTNLLQENKADKEVQEALMELNHNYDGLLKIYKTRVLHSNNIQDTKRLAELYLLTHNKAQAIKSYKHYLDLNPQDLEATKELALLLIDNKDYYQGFGYLEYYNAQKNTQKSNILLAKNYYWHGFSQEALDVLDRFLKKKPENKEALKLKAKILKVAPRFTTSNSGATTSTYFEDLGKKQLYLADTLYFNTHYKASLKYYDDYLQSHPNDAKARYRYAFALENAKAYGRAEGEFSLVLWNEDNTETRYHYAYNLLKNGKLKEAKTEFEKLKKNSYKTLTPPLERFLNSWKEAWQSQNFANYVQYYHDTIRTKQLWSFKKQLLFKNAKFISVGIYDPLYKQEDEQKNLYTIKFYQEYATDKKSDKGYKTLNVSCKKDMQECKIIKETWEKREYKKHLNLLKNIDNNLKDIEYYKLHPQALNSRKKKILHFQRNKNLNIFMT